MTELVKDQNICKAIKCLVVRFCMYHMIPCAQPWIMLWDLILWHSPTEWKRVWTNKNGSDVWRRERRSFCLCFSCLLCTHPSMHQAWLSALGTAWPPSVTVPRWAQTHTQMHTHTHLRPLREILLPWARVKYRSSLQWPLGFPWIRRTINKTGFFF